MEMAAQKISLSSSILLQCKLRDGIELENCPQTEDEFIKREVRLRIKFIELLLSYLNGLCNYHFSALTERGRDASKRHSLFLFLFKKVFRTFLKVFFREKPYCDTMSYKDFCTFSAPQCHIFRPQALHVIASIYIRLH